MLRDLLYPVLLWVSSLAAATFSKSLKDCGNLENVPAELLKAEAHGCHSHCHFASAHVPGSLMSPEALTKLQTLYSSNPRMATQTGRHSAGLARWSRTLNPRLRCHLEIGSPTFARAARNVESSCFFPDFLKRGYFVTTPCAVDSNESLKLPSTDFTMGGWRWGRALCLSIG